MRRVVTGTNSHGRSFVASNAEIQPFATVPFVWESDPEIATLQARAVNPDDIPPGIEPAPTASKLIIGEYASDGRPQPGWHTTRTIDYYYLLDGKVTLDLDEESVELRPGDLVIQQATRHRWRGDGPKPFRFLVVLHRI